MSEPTKISPFTKYMQYIAFGVVGTAILILLYISYLLLKPDDTLRVNKQPLPILQPTTVQPGGMVNIQLDYCKKRAIPSHITIDFVSEAIIPSVAGAKNLPVGCHVRSLPVTLPASTPPGTYELHVTIEYNENTLHRERYEFVTGPVTVVARDQGVQGQQGIQGVQGVQGVQGPSGK